MFVITFMNFALLSTNITTQNTWTTCKLPDSDNSHDPSGLWDNAIVRALDNQLKESLSVWSLVDVNGAYHRQIAIVQPEGIIYGVSSNCGTQ